MVTVTPDKRERDPGSMAPFPAMDSGFSLVLAPE
jgi:hypothetical protein